MSSGFQRDTGKASRAGPIATRRWVCDCRRSRCAIREELEPAKARGARIYAEVAGYGATSDGFDRWRRSPGEGAGRWMHADGAQGCEDSIGLYHPHATSTPIGDLKGIEAIREVFGGALPGTLRQNKVPQGAIRSESCGRARGDLLYLMMNNGFICERRQTSNTRSNPAFDEMPIGGATDATTLSSDACMSIHLDSAAPNAW